MDINLLRVVVTVFSMVMFISIWIWAWRRSNRAAFEDAAQLPFRDEVQEEHRS